MDTGYRWKATITYRAEVGRVPVEYFLEEIEDLQDYVERGPHFSAIEDIRIVYLGLPHMRGLTVEQAEKL